MSFCAVRAGRVGRGLGGHGPGQGDMTLAPCLCGTALNYPSGAVSCGVCKENSLKGNAVGEGLEIAQFIRVLTL